MSKTVLYALFAFCIQAASTQAMPCHCFPTRTFDSAKPVAADPYFLATSQNAFMSVVFGREKKDIVLAKQKPGVTAEGLWVAYWLAMKASKEGGDLLKAHRDSGSWRAAVTLLNIELQKLPPRFAALLGGGADELALSCFIVDSLLVEKGLAPRTELEALRRDGASDQETILASILARKTGQRASQIYGMVRKDGSFWGKLLQKAGFNGGKMVDEIRSMLNDAKGKA